MTSYQSTHLPGRLGDPAVTLERDPRLDPRIAQAMALAGMFGESTEPLPDSASLEDCLAFCQAFEDDAALAHPLMRDAMPAFPGVTTRVETITGVDGNQIVLYVHEPTHRTGAAAGIVHLHGGGMVLMTAADPGFERWRSDLAALGMVVVGVEFRNGGGRLGNHPFPAGLNDCASATRWVHENRESLGIDKLVVTGESGGGNLSLATALKAKAEGWLEAIDGVYAFCPYISGAYASPPAELVSLVENEGYMLSRSTMAPLVRVYDPEQRHGANPLAWPLNAAPEDLAGLPPHVISVNELDPLRDEGLVYYRKLLDAGVSAVGRTVHGTPHAGYLSFPDVVPDIYGDAARALQGFALAL